jgi:hypothetical protein
LASALETLQALSEASLHDHYRRVRVFMNLLRKLSFGSSLLALLASPALAAVTVSSPGNGAQLSSPFTLSAQAATCSSQNVAAMGYSFDSSTSTTIISGTSINTSVSSATGSHTLHVKAWGNQGAACDTDVAINIDGTAATASLTLPGNAISVSAIQTLGNWIATNDSGGSGGSSGWTTVVGSPSLSGHTREYQISFSNSGSERFYASFGDDTTSENFLYDAYVYLGSNSSKLANIEMDLNQTMANGQTAIFGFQCDGWANTWDYTANTGSPTKSVDVWVHSSQYCNPRTWSINTWHHVQISYSRTTAGVVTYHAVYLDGREMPINATVNSAFALGWAPSLLTNFQIDGYGSSGAANVWVDKLTIYRW